jgi:serine/threonine-protein kinase
MDRTLMPGDHLAGHRVHEILGRGSSAIVYRALSPKGAEVALKVLAVDRRTAQKLAQRLAQEGEILASLYHENIVRLLGFGSDEERIWLALELIDGKSLRQWMTDFNGMLPLEDALFTDTGAS